MTAQITADILMMSVVFSLASVIFFGLLPAYRVDCFRQQLFAIRDDLFDYAADGNISFTDPAYVILRQQMNALIRYGHHITLYRSIVTFIFGKLSKPTANRPSWNAQWESALANIKDTAVRERMAGFRAKAEFASAKHLVTGSIPLTILITLVGFWALAKVGWTSLRQLKRAAFARVLVGPLDPRQIDEDAFCASAS